MDQASDILKINIYGTEYPIKSGSEAEAEYILKVAAYVDKKMREIDQNTQAKSSLKVAILAALNITDELFQEREKSESLINKVEDKIKNLSDSLNPALDDE